MSHRDDRAKVLADLTREARAHLVPPTKSREDAEEAERKLFAKIDAHEALPRIGKRSDARFWGSVSAITAVAAAALVFAHAKDHGENAAGAALDRSPSLEAPAPEPARPTAPAELAAMTHGGEARVDGVAMGVREASLHDGQTVEAHGGEALFAAPGRVNWLLENGTEVGVTRSGGARGGAIILALRVGAVEAQVVPVPNGEAFGVDVEGVRVAVHGTHLRVAREERGGTHVVVDLSEGVISVGAPPKSGSTVGLLVTAPAHVEFSVADLEGTLRVDHDPASVRAAVDPSVEAHASDRVADVPAAPPAVAPPILPGPVAAVNPANAAPRGPTAVAPKPANPTEVILAAVHRCADETLSPGTGVLTLTSTLTVDVNSDGSSRLASFDPPLPPEMQSCVGRVVYATRWTEAGAHRIPIELRR